MKRIKAENYKKMIHNVAYGWFLKTGIDFEEFEAEGWFAYTKAIRNWDTDKPFKPYLKAIAWNEMKRYAKKFQPNVWLEFEPTSSIAQPDTNASFKDSIERLSKEAKEVCKTVLNCPDELLDLVKRKEGNLTKATVRRYLSEKGWKHETMNYCFKEIAAIWM